jgi:pimeloyl-ACP methyl ester carboxylesterase
VVAVLAASCSGGGGSDDAPSTTRRTSTTRATTTSGPRATTSSTPTTSSTTPPTGSTLDWSDCDGGFECAELEVPLDHRNPRGREIRLAIARRPATDPDRRIGTLLLNPGGPGASAIDAIESSPLPAELTARFDIVGFDPRGVGRSTPLNCRRHLQEMYDADPTIDSAADRTLLLRVSKAFVDQCATVGKDLLPFLGTADVARDMDLVRAALGEEQVTYLGYSYGTSIGQQYARLFPTRVRAMVLDGVVDPTLSGLDAATQQAEGFSRSLDAFIDECDRNNCGLGTSAGDVIDEVIADAEERPIRASDRPAGPGVVALALAQGMYTTELWPQLARALAQARGGSGTGLVRLADSFLHRRADRTYPNGFEVYFGTSCLDSAWPDDPQKVLDVGKVVGLQFPRLGEAIVTDYVRCALWPGDPKPLTGLTRAVKGLAPVVLVSTTDDPATPHAGAVRVARNIPRSVLVTNRGDGHTIYAQGKDCIDRPVTAYLTDLTLPRAGIVCE